MSNIFIESLIIGLATAFVGFIVSTGFMFIFSRDFDIKEYTFWPQVVFAYFVTGILIHLIYEFTGMNKKFCCDRNYKCS